MTLFSLKKRLFRKLLVILENTQFSMAGGSLYNDNPYYDYSGLIEIDDKRNFRLREGSMGEVSDSFSTVGKHFDCKQVDIIANFFMASTKAVQKVRWDDSLKLGEHQDFFLRYKQEGFKVASCGKDATVYHKQDHSDPDYKRKRQREYSFLRKFLSKHNLNSFILFTGVTYIKCNLIYCTINCFHYNSLNFEKNGALLLASTNRCLFPRKMLQMQLFIYVLI